VISDVVAVDDDDDDDNDDDDDVVEWRSFNQNREETNGLKETLSVSVIL